MAVALTLGLVAWVTTDGYGGRDLALLLVRQLGLGLLLGVGLGLVAAWAFSRLAPELAPFAPVLSLATAALAFGAVDVVGGSGFLAVYIVGLFVGNVPGPFTHAIVTFHHGLAFLAQIVLFVVLGLLVFPSDLADVIVPGLALAAVLLFVARPLAVLASLPFPVPGLGLRERVFVGWAGLRGAVPIVLATFALSADVAESDLIFDAVFFVVLVSALAQGPTLEPLARRLGLATEARPLYVAPLEVGAIRSLGADVLELPVDERSRVTGARLRELGLPPEAVVVVIVRDREAIPPRGSTEIRAGDRVYVLVRGAARPLVEDIFTAVRDGAGHAA